MFGHYLKFFQTDLWLVNEQGLPYSQAKIVKYLKIFILSFRNFGVDLCQLRASALTLYCILSIVPVIAMLFGIAKGFGFETMLEQELLQRSPDQDTLVLQMIGFAKNLLDSAKGEVVAGIGIVVLFWTIISLIGNIEASFNYIWKIDKGRSLGRKFSDYLSLMLLAPVLLIAASSISVFVSTQITWLITLIQLPAFPTWLVVKALSLSPMLLMIALFSFTFIFMPNHTISWRAGFIAGTVTGVGYQVLQWGYLSLQIGVSSYNAIYGSFAALPLFVVWLQSCWIIVLFGCEMAFFIQYYQTYRTNRRFRQLSFVLTKQVALQVMHLIVKNFSQSQPSLSAAQIADRLTIPLVIVQEVLTMLLRTHLLFEIQESDEHDKVYLPAVDSHLINISLVVNALEEIGQTQLTDFVQEPVLTDALSSFKKTIEVSERNVFLIDI